MASLWLSAIYWGDETDQVVPYAFPDITYKELALWLYAMSNRIIPAKRAITLEKKYLDTLLRFINHQSRLKQCFLVQHLN